MTGYAISEVSRQKTLIHGQGDEAVV